MTWPKNGPIWSSISGSTGPIFAIFTPPESALRADNGSVVFFPIFQRTLPWQPTNTGVMKANLYYVHSLYVRQMLVQFCFDTTY